MSIRNVSVKVSYPLAEVLADKGLKVLPERSSILEDLFNTSYTKSHINENLEELSNRIYENTTFPVRPTGNMISIEELVDKNLSTIHSQILDTQVKEVAAAVTSHIKIARNKVVPLVNEMNDTLESLFKRYTIDLDPTLKFTIKEMYLPTCMNVEAFVEQFNKYRGKMYNHDNVFLSLDLNLSDEDIIKLIGTGDNDLDQSLAENVSGLSKDFIRKLFNGYFNFKNTYNRDEYFDYDSMMRMNAYEKLYFGLYLYLMSNKLMNEPHEDIKTVSLDELTRKCSALKEFAGSLVISSYDNIQSYISSGLLVMSINDTEYYCLVVGEVYKLWIQQEGNSADLLFALVAEDRPYHLVNEIEANKEDLLKDWNNYINFSKVANKTKALNVLKNTIIETFYKELNDGEKQLDFENEYRVNHPDYLKIVKYKLEQLLESLKLNDLDNLYLLALKLVAEIRFYYTSSATILFAMRNALDNDTDLDIKDAALLATIQYVGKYISSMIRKTPKV